MSRPPPPHPYLPWYAIAPFISEHNLMCFYWPTMLCFPPKNGKVMWKPVFQNSLIECRTQDFDSKTVWPNSEYEGTLLLLCGIVSRIHFCIMPYSTLRHYASLATYSSWCFLSLGCCSQTMCIQRYLIWLSKLGVDISLSTFSPFFRVLW